MLRIPPPGVPIGSSALACDLLLLLQTTYIIDIHTFYITHDITFMHSTHYRINS